MRTWIDVDEDSHFPPQNLPYGVVTVPDGAQRCVARVGDHVLDLWQLREAGLIDLPVNPFDGDLNHFASLGKEAWAVTRDALTALLGDDPRLRDDDDLRGRAVLHLEQVEVTLP